MKEARSKRKQEAPKREEAPPTSADTSERGQRASASLWTPQGYARWYAERR
tara:strand:- start:47 stop:199 length:153 start_codon:yes stop_codon:yes gene_type:complete